MTAIKVMCVGHSIVKGEATPGGWRWPLQKMLRTQGVDYTFVGPQTTNSTGMDDPEHAGYDSQTFTDQNGNIAGWMTTYAPDVVIVMLGINDLLGGSSAASVDGLLNTFLTNLYGVSASCRVYVCDVLSVFSPYAGLGGVPGDIATRVTDTNALYATRCTTWTTAGKFCKRVDFANLSMASGDTIDGVHPNAHWYHEIGGRIAKRMLVNESAMNGAGVSGEQMLWTYGATLALMAKALEVGFTSVITPARPFDPAADELLLDQADALGIGVVFNTHAVVDNWDNGDVDWQTPFAAWLARIRLKKRAVAIVTYDEPEDGTAGRRANLIAVCAAIHTYSPLPTIGVFSSYIFTTGVYADWGGYHRFEATGVYPEWSGMDCLGTPAGVAGYIGSSGVADDLWAMVVAGSRVVHVFGCFGILGAFNDDTCGDVGLVSSAEQILLGDGTNTGLLNRIDNSAPRFRMNMWWTWAAIPAYQQRFVGLAQTSVKWAEMRRVLYRARNLPGAHPYKRIMRRGESVTFSATGGAATWSLVGAPAGVAIDSASGTVSVSDGADEGVFIVRATIGSDHADAVCVVVEAA